jgi:hypothetical protein
VVESEDDDNAAGYYFSKNSNDLWTRVKVTVIKTQNKYY